MPQPNVERRKLNKFVFIVVNKGKALVYRNVEGPVFRGIFTLCNLHQYARDFLLGSLE